MRAAIGLSAFDDWAARFPDWKTRDRIGNETYDEAFALIRSLIQEIRLIPRMAPSKLSFAESLPTSSP